MLLAQIMKYTIFSPLEHCVKKFGCVVVGITARILFGQMICPLMSGILPANNRVSMLLISFKVSTFINKLVDHRPQSGNALPQSRPGWPLRSDFAVNSSFSEKSDFAGVNWPK